MEGCRERKPRKYAAHLLSFGGLCVLLVLTSNRSFYPTSSVVHPVSVLIPYPRGVLQARGRRLRARQEKHRNRNRKKTIANSRVKQVDCHRTGSEDTSTQARPQNQNKKTLKTKLNSGMKHTTNDAREIRRVAIEY